MTLTLAGLVVLALAGLSSCSDDPTRPEGTTGRLQLYLVDAPPAYEELEALHVVFNEVKVHASSDAKGEIEDEEASWITVMSDTLPEAARTFDLLELVGGVRALLGDVELEAGHYTQLRIIIEEATVTVAGETHPLKIPSGAQSGLKLTGGWDVDPNVVTSLTLDFDAEKSLKETPPGSGNFMFKPTIRMVQTVLSGTISGTVTPTGIGVLVSAYDAVADTLVTSAHVDTAGAYVLHALLAGTYDVEASAGGYESARTEEVDVQAGEDTGNVDFTLTPISE
jgi:hypothetical protein